MRGKQAGLTLKPEDGTIDIRLAKHHAGVVGQVACRKIIGAIHDDVPRSEKIEGVVPVQSQGEGHHLHLRVQALEGFAG